MTLDRIIQKAYKMATGDDEDISSSEPAYDKYISILSDLQRDWYNESLTLSNERWASLEAERTIPVTNTEAYELDGELVRSPLNYSPLQIKLIDGKIIIPKLVSNRAFNNSTDEAIFTTTADGKNIRFKHRFAESIVGGEIIYPYYKPLTEVEKDNDDSVLVDNINWLIYMLAAEIARSDIVQAGQYGNLIALADNAMTSMKNRQRGLRIAEMDPWRIKR